jgi:hypothetical protein
MTEMTRDDVIRLAREAHMHHMAWDDDYIEGTERFAALVAAPLEEEIKRLRFCIPEGDAAAAMEYLAYCVEKAVAEERKACAKIADDEANDAVTAGEHNPKSNAAWNISLTAKRVAAAIRARGNK